MKKYIEKIILENETYDEAVKNLHTFDYVAALNDYLIDYEEEHFGNKSEIYNIASDINIKTFQGLYIMCRQELKGVD